MDIYILKLSAILVIFWLLYVLLLEREQMHKFKRFYLITSVLAAVIIPLLSITEYVYIAPIEEDTSLLASYAFPLIQEMIIEEVSFFTLEKVLWMIYTLGVIIFGLRFLKNLVTLFITVKQNEKIKQWSFTYVLLKKAINPHTFFNYIFFNKSTYKNKTLPEAVILHEETHAKQKHSIDVLFIELMQVALWFHPLVYLYKRNIKLNHEFLADEAVLNKGIEAANYQKILLTFSSQTDDHQLANAINYSSIKKRFTVMKTTTSKTRIWVSSLLLLPIIAIIFYSFAEKEYVEKENSKISEAIATELEKANDLQVIYQGGATESMMKEYKDWIKQLNNNSSSLFIPVGTWERLVAIYDLMSEEQRNSVETHPFLQEITPYLYSAESSIPTTAQFESWKNEKEFAIWLDGKHISNSELNNYKINDIAHYVGSSVHSNAKSKKFAQPFQFSLYTKDGFNKFYKEVFVSDYRALTKTYSNAINTYLKGSQTDNSELRIIKAQADKFYNQFTKEELDKYNILPVPPVPTEKKLRSSQSKIKTSKGGPNNIEDTQDIYNPSFLEYIIEMEKEGATFYLDDEKISIEKAKSIATNNKGKSTEMLTQKDVNGNYIVKLSSSTKNNRYARSIDLKILNDNSYLIAGIKATKQTFIDVFNQLHQDITPEIRNNIMNIHVSSSKEVSNKEVWYIYNSLINYGFYRIVTDNQEINRAKGNTPFAIESSFSTQEKATAKQIAEYNAWAKKSQTVINAAKATENEPKSKRISYPKIKQKDFEKYKHIYSIMSAEQKKSAESFPNIPSSPPPPPPKVKKKTSSTEHKIIEIEEVEAPKIKNAKTQSRSVLDAYVKKHPESVSRTTINGEVTEIVEIPSDQEGTTEILGKKYKYVTKDGFTTYYDSNGKEYNEDDFKTHIKTLEKQKGALKELTKSKGGPNANNMKLVFTNEAPEPAIKSGSKDYRTRQLILRASKKQTKPLVYKLNKASSDVSRIENYLKEHPEANVSFKSGDKNTLYFSDNNGSKMSSEDLQKVYTQLFKTYAKTDETIVYLRELSEEEKSSNCLEIPNSFLTKKNSTLNIKCIDKFSENKFQVFNKWGALIYSKENYNNDWDGTVDRSFAQKGSDKPLAGTYYYVFTSPKLDSQQAGPLLINTNKSDALKVKKTTQSKKGKGGPNVPKQQALINYLKDANAKGAILTQIDAQSNRIPFYDTHLSLNEAIALVKNDTKMKLYPYQSPHSGFIVLISNNVKNMIPELNAKNRMEHVNVLASIGAKFYIDDNEVSHNKALKFLKRNKNSKIISNITPPVVNIKSGLVGVKGKADLKALKVIETRTAFNGINYNYYIKNNGNTIIPANSYDVIFKVDGKPISFDKSGDQLNPEQTIKYTSSKTFYKSKTSILNYALEIKFKDADISNNVLKGQSKVSTKIAQKQVSESLKALDTNASNSILKGQSKVAVADISRAKQIIKQFREQAIKRRLKNLYDYLPNNSYKKIIGPDSEEKRIMVKHLEVTNA